METNRRESIFTAAAIGVSGVLVLTATVWLVWLVFGYEPGL